MEFALLHQLGERSPVLDVIELRGSIFWVAPKPGRLIAAAYGMVQCKVFVQAHNPDAIVRMALQDSINALMIRFFLAADPFVLTSASAMFLWVSVNTKRFSQV